MGQILTAFPNQPSFRQTMTLGDTQFGLRLTWRHRLAAWYADLFAANGDTIWAGVRVSPGWALGIGLVQEGEPAGSLFVRGPSEYERLDLGSTVQIVFYSDDEMDAARAAAATDEDAVTVTL